jgi:hypothetical protein
MNLAHKIRLLVALWISIFASSSIAQQNKVDSLKSLLKNNVSNDTNKVQVLYRLCFLLRENEPIEAMKYGNSALKLALDLNYLKGVASSYNNLASVYDNIGKKKGSH